MKHLSFLLTMAAISLCNTASCQSVNTVIESSSIAQHMMTEQKNALNFFVISKRKKGKFDLATRYNVFRTKMKCVLHGKRFSSIVARNTADMQQQIERRLQKGNSAIGTIWFDSHGSYKKGYALFSIGTDEINYRSINHAQISGSIKKLSLYATSRSRFIIGSCYGGATFARLVNDYKDTTSMRGDSLMISMGDLLQHGVIYGSESWVMSRPGLFLKRLSVYGNPGRKIFHDKYYQPAWEHVGEWNKYSAQHARFERANAITLNSNGQLIEFTQPYQLKKKYKKSIKKIVANLQPDLIHIKS